MKHSKLMLPVVFATILASTSLVVCRSAAAAGTQTYYVSPNGNDSNDGLSSGSPWRTVARVNGASFNPGDAILFQRGGQWHESLIAPSSGSQASPITFADYGSGAKPKFWGSVVLDNSQFQSVSPGIYIYPMQSNAYSVLVDHGFFDYAFGQPATNFNHSWSYGGGQIMINSPDSDPRYDGRQYTAVLRDDVVYSNYQSHLVFSNLVVDESARYDDNGGYGFRVMGGQDVLIADCEAYHAGKHHFGVINSTQFVGRNLTAAYAAPGQQSSGGASAYVSYGDTSTGLFAQTSEWHNVTASHMEDPQENSIYYAFLDHGATITSILLDHLQSYGAGVSLSNQDNLAAKATMTGGLIQNARLELEGVNILADGVELSGPLASIDVNGSNTVMQNMLIHGTNMGSAWYQTAILSRGTNNTLRFSTIDMDPASGSNTCIATTNAIGSFHSYGNILLAPQRIFALWDQYLSAATINESGFNFFTPGSTFASFVGGPFQWSDQSFAQWQAAGFDGGSIQGDPKFVSASDGNFHPLLGSPVIDAALLPSSLVADVPTDFEGNVRLQGQAFDMGAFEGANTAVPAAATTTTASLNNGILTAQVTTQSGTPLGSVDFYDGTNLLNTAQLFNGSASTAVSLNSTDAHSLTATYEGDAEFKPSVSQPISIDPVTTITPAPPVAPVAPEVPVLPVPPVVPPTPVAPIPQNYPIALIYPADGQSVNGIVVVMAAIGQTLDSAGSQLWVDGHPLDDRRIPNPPYAYGLDTAQLSPGAHQLQVWAHDINNNNLLSNSITILVTP
jgi:hypothetical protein